MKNKEYPYIDTVIYDDFRDLLKDRFERDSEKTAVRYFVKKEIKEVSYGQFIKEISAIYGYYNDNDFRGKHIAIYMENRYEYITVYLAGIFDSVIVPIDKEMDADSLAKCIDSFDVSVIFCSNKTKENVQAAGKEILICNVDEIYENMIGQEYSEDQFFEATANVDKDRFAVLVTTSGTDGTLKGVMLSQYNIVTNIRGTLENNLLGNPTFCFLPMNHTYGMNPGVLVTFYNGTTVCLSSGMKHFMRDLKAFNPDFFGAVPLVIETIYDNIQREAKRQNKDKFLKNAIKLSQFLRKFHIDIRHLLFKNLLCPGLTKIVNGGAPLSPYYVERFDEIGIKVLNGYGLTECSPTVSVNREFNMVPGSVGTIMKNIDVKVASDGELLVAGPGVMLGYYKDEAATRECMIDGYVKTGDIGYTDGRVLFVTGRKKNLIVLDNGKKVAPEQIEEKLTPLPYIKDAIVVPRKINGKSLIITALIKFMDDEDLAKSEEKLKEDIKLVNEKLPSFMAIENYEIVNEDFEKTTTKKIKRNMYV